MKKVFICSQFRGPEKRNVKLARRYCAYAASLGYASFAPHLLYPQFLSDQTKKDRELAIRSGMTFLQGCDEMWVFLPSWNSYPSSGMIQEMEECSKLLHIKIRTFAVKKQPFQWSFRCLWGLLTGSPLIGLKSISNL